MIASLTFAGASSPASQGDGSTTTELLDFVTQETRVPREALVNVGGVPMTLAEAVEMSTVPFPLGPPSTTTAHGVPVLAGDIYAAEFALHVHCGDHWSVNAYDLSETGILPGPAGTSHSTVAASPDGYGVAVASAAGLPPQVEIYYGPASFAGFIDAADCSTVMFDGEPLFSTTTLSGDGVFTIAGV